MSHLKERIEKNCLNCNAIVNGKYCSVCGQENIEPKESVWHIIAHFFNDITHFDGNFFSSLKYLMLKPGFLSSEYMRGRRQAYLNPIRFYVFTSFIFFLIAFAFIGDNSQGNSQWSELDDDTKKAITSKQKAKLDTSNNSLGTDTIRYNTGIEKGSTSAKEFFFSKFESKEQYDSLLTIQKVSDGYFKKIITHKQLELREKYDGDISKLKDSLKEKFLHNLPLMFLFSLPFFAVFLKLIYIRRKKYFYVAHTIFAIHLYIFTYVALLVSLGCSWLREKINFGFFDLLGGLISIYILYYWYKSFRVFYGQGRIKTVIKFLLVFFWLFFILILLLFLLFFYSLYKM